MQQKNLWVRIIKVIRVIAVILIVIIAIIFLKHYYYPSNYYTKYEIIKYDELPQAVKDGFNNYIGESYEVGEICYDASQQCKSCKVYNDDKALLGLITQREPHLVITLCNRKYEVPITMPAASFFVIYNGYIYFPKTGFDAMGYGKKVKEEEDLSKLKYGVIKVK